MIVAISDLQKLYGSGQSLVEALLSVSLTVGEREVVSIVGPSGCGKTTLLRIIAGLTSPTRGTVELGALPPEEFRERGDIGFVFQKATLFPWRTILQNLLLPLEISGGRETKAAIDRAHDLLELLGLKGFENFYPKELSGGMLQRAALARAAMNEPRLLLLDEPFNALDEQTREKLWTDFSAFWRERQLTTLLVTHSVREAAFLSDRVLVMSQRPGRFLKDIPIRFPRPRKRELLLTPGFAECCETLRGCIE